MEKLVFVLFLLHDVYSFHEGLNPDLGIHITHYKDIMMGQSTIDVIFKLENIEELILQKYEDPCRLVHDVLHALPSAQIAYFREAKQVKNTLRKICDTFVTMQATQVNIAEAYEISANRSSVILQALRPPRRRPKRSIGRSIRNFFGIADESDQTELQKKVKAITKELFTQNGQMVNMSFAIKQHSARLQYLENALDSFSQTLNETVSTVNLLVQSYASNVAVTNVRLRLLEQAITVGNTQHHLANLHAMMLRNRAEGMLSLAKGKLSPKLISPNDLLSMLRKLDTALEKTFPQMEHLRYNLYEFYTTAEVVGYRDDENIFVMLRIPLDFEDQGFSIYELQAFPVMAPGTNYSTLIKMDHPFVAINTKHNAYFSLEIDYVLQYCKGYETLRCQHLMFQHHIQRDPTCEISVLQMNITKIERDCDIVFVHNDQLQADVVEVNTTHLFVSNPREEEFYLRCHGQRHPEIITNNVQFTIVIPCFCQLTSKTVMTPTLFHDGCVTFDRQQTIVSHHRNVVFAALLNVKTWNALKNISFDIPAFAELLFPELVSTVGDIVAIDAKGLITQSYDEYEKTLFGRTSKNLDILTDAKVSWFMPSFSTFISVVSMIIVIIIIVAFKYNKLASLMSILGLVKKSDALLLDTSSTLVVTFECFSIFLCLCTAIYCSIKYFAIARRIYRNITSPCCESIQLYKPPACNVLFYMGNATNYAYLHIGELIAPPHTMTLVNDYMPIEITFHRSMCSSFITLSKHGLILKTDEHTFALPTAIAVPIYLQNTVDQLVHHHPLTLQLLVGYDGIYRSFPLIAMGPPKPYRAPIAMPSTSGTLRPADTTVTV